MKKKLLAILLVLIMLVGMLPTSVFAAESETVYLAFTSDVHNGYSGWGGSGSSVTAAERLDNWLDGVASHLGGISFEAMGFCGDNGSAFAGSESVYWNYVQEVMDTVDDNNHVEDAYFTAGNHEHMNGNLGSTTNVTAKKIKVIGETVETDSYIIYCFGASQQSEEYTENNINTLKAYLEDKKDSDKPIFILTHFPLHTFSSRTTKNADKVIDLLNGFPNVVFLWGHNHTMSDPNYDQIFKRGSTLTYASGKTKEINFTYCAAGCMSDSEYTTGSQSVEGKGLVAKINNGEIEFTYYDLSYASIDSEPGDPVIPSVVPEEGKQYLIVADDDYALTSKQGVGYSNSGSGSQKYNYEGFLGVAFTSGMEITDDMLWTFTAVDGGYNISNGGDHLNGLYVENSTGGYNGTLGLNNVKDLWTLSGSMLKSSNSSTGPRGDKFLTHGNGDASENLFSVRSQENASTLEFYEVENGDIVVPEHPETTDHEIDITSTSSGASSKATIKVGDTLTINLKNGSSYNAKNFTNTVADETIAKIVSGNSLNIDANSTKAIVVEGLKAGVTTITCTGTSSSGSTYTATITLTVVDSDTPNDPEEPVEGTVYKQVSAIADGKEYLIVDESTNSGKFYALTNKGGTSGGTAMDRTEVTIVDNTVDYIVTEATDIVWSAAANVDGFSLTNGGDFLEGKSGEVKIYNPVQYADRYWTYVDGKLQHKGGTNTYTVYYSSGNFTSSYGTSDEKVYLFEKTVEEVCDHSYGEWELTEEATCTEAGTETRTCSICYDTDTRVIPANGHTEVIDAAIAPTCTATGLTEGKHCEVCEVVIVVQEEIQALGHTSGEPVRENEVAATETENGSYDEVVYCTVCDEELSRVTKTIPATGGTVCDHEYGEWVVTKEATCTETGTKTRTCSICNETETSVIVAKGHTPGDPVRENEVAATKTKKGSYDEVVYCTVCSVELSRETKTIPATGGSGGGGGAGGGGGGGGVIHYTLTFNTDGGSAINSLSKSSGTKVDLSVYAPTKDGFVFDGWYANIALTEKITSVELKKDTTVFAKWTEKADSGKFPFTDVKDGDWFHDDVKYVYEKRLMMGTSDATFSPDATTSRGMIVTILYRLEGEPAVSGICPFDDVTAGMYYEKAIIWAATNGIVSGYSNNKFGPNDNITREQMAAILYRYANYKGYDVSVGEDTNILSFDDAFSISEYAIPAFQWACGSGIIYGSASTLSPQGNATRVQAAAILHRFCELNEQ